MQVGTLGLFGLTLAAVSILASASASGAEQITFVSQGGAYQEAQTVAILDPVAKALGLTINQDSAPDQTSSPRMTSPTPSATSSGPGDAGAFNQSGRIARRG